jgi:rhodanese-related sulfurtransferase
MKNALLAFAVIFMATSVYAAPKKGATTDVDCKNENLYKEISKDELKKDIESNSIFAIDVNGKDSYAEHHIGNAIHFGSTKDFAKALPADKNAPIVAYCGGPSCTAWKKAAMAACKLHYVNIRHYKGGISEWVKN